MERSRREQELEKEVLKLKNRLAATEDQRIISQEEQEVHQKVKYAPPPPINESDYKAHRVRCS